ncbi:MAG: VanZ family protein [Clostridiales bacterium]|nr:VanZ family protein [Clostridiales bacterium]
MIQQIITVLQQQIEGISMINLAIVCIWACVLVGIALLVRVRFFGKECSWLTIIMWFLLTIYICILLFLTLGNRELGSRGSIRWIPFNSLMQANGKPNMVAWTLAGLNLILFVPFGTIVSFLQDQTVKKRAFIYISIESFALSTLIEVTQKFTKLGYCETEDIILNTLGGMLGWCIAQLISYLVHRDDD